MLLNRPQLHRQLHQSNPVKKSTLAQQFRRLFTVLALESSCDDSCAAVVTSSRQILSNVVVKQIDIHEGFGGVHPFEAIEGHQRNMPGAIRRALEEAGLGIMDVDGIAYTRGPGIGGCLSVGSNAAKNISAATNKPLVAVHHMQAHALTPFLTTPEPDLPKYPFLTLLVSGGHTLLLLATSIRNFSIIATTVDESIGCAFDKVSRMLGLSWKGLGPGAALENFCAANDSNHILPEMKPLPRPMPRQLAFSYSGLHSGVERFISRHQGELDYPTKLALARAFQEAAVAQLEEKITIGLKLCAQEGHQIGHLVVSGGVASNDFLRKRLKVCLSKVSSESPVSLVFPPPALCTDNAAMIAWASMHRFLAHDHDDHKIKLRAKWSIEEL